MPKLFVHIGAGKCASTAIQRFLFNNAVKLNERGMLIADQNLRFGSTGGNPLWLFQNLLDAGLSGEIVSSAIDELGDRDGIVTAENLSNPLAAKLFSDVARRFDIHVLHVIRRQDEWLYSSWKQWYSKVGCSLPDYIDYALRKGDPGFARTVAAWSPVSKSVRTISLDVIASLEAEILRWLGITDDGTFVQMPRNANSTFDFRMINLLSRHHAAHEGPHDTKIDDFITTYSKLAQSEKFGLPQSMSSKVMAHFHDDNVALLGAEVANKLRDRGCSSKLPASGFSETAEHDFIIACLIEAMGRMSAEVAQLRADLNHMYSISKATDQPG